VIGVSFDITKMPAMRPAMPGRRPSAWAGSLTVESPTAGLRAARGRRGDDALAVVEARLNLDLVAAGSTGFHEAEHGAVGRADDEHALHLAQHRDSGGGHQQGAHGRAGHEHAREFTGADGFVRRHGDLCENAAGAGVGGGGELCDFSGERGAARG
jgi:hypothetical protein